MEKRGPMCTVTWLRSNSGYELLCNRDERHTRLPGVAPLQRTQSGVRYIAPMDGNHGGSWMAVNHFRISFCLLNRYITPSSSKDEKKAYRSRGLLTFDLVDSPSLMEVRERVSGSCLEQYEPFTLLALEPDAPALLLDWSGSRLFHQFNDENIMLLVSSSYDQRGAEIARRELFNRMRSERGESYAEWIHNFHASHLPYRGPYSPCMHRDDASTVSFSSVRVAGNRIEFSYFLGAPCEQTESIQRRKQEKSLQTFILSTVDELIKAR
jgi:Transport and Golgi organisation 2